MCFASLSKRHTYEANTRMARTFRLLNNGKHLCPLRIRYQTAVGRNDGKGSGKQVYAGINDGIHDIFTNSAGEGNISKIILAVLSFKRLKDKYKSSYKGGILLIDELDATLYGFSQKKLLKYLLDSAKEYKIQIIFTTHSPIVLNEMYKLQKEEIKKSGIKTNQYAYDNVIVYLSPDYKEDGSRMINAENVAGSTRLNEVINDINLVPISIKKRVNAYFEDTPAMSFAVYLLKRFCETNLDNYISFIDVNLGYRICLNIIINTPERNMLKYVKLQKKFPQR